jgi:hypothetical protein
MLRMHRIIHRPQKGFTMSDLRKMKRTKRHPAEVTADRLGDAYERFYDKFDGAELDMISQLKHAFDEIAAGNR